MLYPICLAILTTLPGFAAGHASIFHPSMYGFNVTESTFPYDNRPVSPLIAMSFDQWWFHGHLGHPPHSSDVYQLPAGKPATFEIACTKSATSFFASSEGGNIQNGNDPCPGSPPSEYHTTGIDDVKGCALAIAYKSDANSTRPEDFTIFSVNQTCVWNRFTEFQVPKRMPPCPPGGCTCAWFWIHSPNSGGEQNYMTGFNCNVTDSASTVPIAKAQVPRRCGADPVFGKTQASPGNCTYGAKQPFYWFQKEQNNMFEGTYAPPFYTNLYNFLDGPQDDIFVDSYLSMPAPTPNASLPLLNPNVGAQSSNISSGAGSSASPIEVSTVPASIGTSSAGTATVRMTSTVFVTVSAVVSVASATAAISSSRFEVTTSPVPSSVSTSVSELTTILLNTPSASPAHLSLSLSLVPSDILSTTISTSLPGLLDVQPTSSLPYVPSSTPGSSSSSNNVKTCKVSQSTNANISSVKRRSLHSSFMTHITKKRKLRNGDSLWHFF